MAVAIQNTKVAKERLKPGLVACCADHDVWIDLPTVGEFDPFGVVANGLCHRLDATGLERRNEAVIQRKGDPVAQHPCSATIRVTPQPMAPKVAEGQPLDQGEGRIQQRRRERGKELRRTMQRKAKEALRQDRRTVPNGHPDL